MRSNRFVIDLLVNDVGNPTDLYLINRCRDATNKGVKYIYKNAFLSIPPAYLAQLVEHRFCKPTVTGSTPIVGSFLQNFCIEYQSTLFYKSNRDLYCTNL